MKKKYLISGILVLVLTAFLVSAIPYEIYSERIAHNPARNASLYASHHHLYNVTDGRIYEKWVIYPEFAGRRPSSSEIILYGNGQVEIVSKGGLLVNGRKVCTVGDISC